MLPREVIHSLSVFTSDNGFLAEVGNPDDLAKKINQLIEDDALRIQMGKNSRKRLLEKFSIEAYVKNYSDEYCKLI